LTLLSRSARRVSFQRSRSSLRHTVASARITAAGGAVRRFSPDSSSNSRATASCSQAVRDAGEAMKAESVISNMRTML
jgi:hypothetical protein